MATETTTEKRVRRLEDLLSALKGVLEGIKHKLGQVAEDNTRDTKPLPGLGSVRHYFAQANGTITASSSNTFGTGNAFLLQKIDGSRHQLDPEVSVPVVNSTGGAIATFTYLELILSKGIYSVVVGDCITPTPTKAPPPPEPEEEEG